MTGALWLAWRQQRSMILVCAVLLAACTAWVVHMRSEMMTLIDTYDFVPCKGWNGGCESLGSFMVLDGSTGSIRALGLVGFALPALVGVFWGAPLLGREIENGTDKLALTQGIGARSWFAARFGLAALSAVAVSTVIAALVAWWWAPVSNTLDGLYWHDVAIYNATGPASVACTLLGLTIGTAAGLLVRRVLPAMAVTVAAVGTVAVFTTYFRRSWVEPERRVTPGMVPKTRVGSAWSWEFGYLTPDGREYPISQYCQTSGDPLRQCMAENGFVARYHKVYPSSDFWVFQWIETVLYLGVAAALIALVLFVLRGPAKSRATTAGPAADATAPTAAPRTAGV
ncbi:transporter [Streptomyces subrutilus]|uniref:Transporter n=1 Tax=Streptomyces subrutilus TaxID=36818 RepID=A0A5P2URL6_9ACTN|nr:transporter [Streptomyces subrutilus]QEU81530.1 transporter [Streptomyces subrutilus]GGZ88292.1 transporter [Streptomyces subrutilus]